VTHQLLVKWSEGDQKALDTLMPLVYSELRRLASNYLRRERQNHTLQPTALVNEAYLKLVDQKSAHWQNRAQFYGVAAQLMRRILVDHARQHKADKRGGSDQQRLSITSAGQLGEKPDMDLLALHEALEELTAMDPQQGRIVELKFFGGLSIEETAEVMSIGHATVAKRRDGFASVERHNCKWSPDGKYRNPAPTLKGSKNKGMKFDPSRVGSINDSDPGALPPAIKFVRCANSLTDFLCKALQT
jgi:RNA polymerase sigma factor (TIGR02999 family)